MTRNAKYTLSSIFILMLTVTTGVLMYLRNPVIIKHNQLQHPLGNEYAELIIDQNENYHIYAANDADLFEILGYLQAADHLVQMDLFLRAATGTLSEAFGKQYIDLDIYSRTVGFARIGADFIDRVDPAVYQILTAYCQGINAYIDDYTHNLPREFKLKRYSPARWKPEHCLAIQRLLAWSVSDQLTKKAMIYKLLEIYGVKKVRDGFPVFNNLPPELAQHYNTRYFADLNRFVNAHIKMTALLGIKPQQTEDSWTLSANRTVSRTTALGGKLPAFLTDYHDLVELNSPGLHVSGLILPGIPFVLFGSNAQIAWNITIRPVDNLEYLRLSPESPVNPISITENISVRNAEDTSITVIETELGPIISQAADSARELLVIQWGGYEFSDDLRSYPELYRTTDWETFKQAVSHHVTPAVKVDFIDSNNNIGTAHYVSDIEISQRSERLPSLSRIYEPDYIGPIHHLFRYLNPQTGIIRHHQALPNFLADSIVSGDVLLADTTHQLDTLLNLRYDRQAQLLLPLIYDILSADDLHQARYRRAYELLQSWDFMTVKPGPALVIFSTYVNTLAEMIYRDEMDLADRQLFDQFRQLNQTIYPNLTALLDTGKSSWFDDIRTTQTIERRKTIVTAAFIQTIDHLTERYSGNVQQWVPENCLPEQQVEDTRLLLALENQPVIYRSSNRVIPVSRFSRENRLDHKTIRLHGFNRTELTRNGGRLISVHPE